MDPTSVMRGKMQRALERVNQVLEATRDHPQLCENVHHSYRDKFAMVEASTQAFLAAQVNALVALGLTPAALQQLIDWSKTQSVTLRFVAEECTSYLREESNEETDPTKRVTEGGMFGTVTSKVVRTIKEYFWRFTFSYRIVAYRGVGRGPEDFVEICSRSGDLEMVTRSKTCPTGDAVKGPTASHDVNVSWLLRHMIGVGGAFQPSFTIDRSDEACRTPRRNPQVLGADTAASKLQAWGQLVQTYLYRDLASKADFVRIGDAAPKLPDPSTMGPIFEPILPVLYPAPQGTAGVADGGARPDFPVLVAEGGQAAPSEGATTTTSGTGDQQVSLALTATDMNRFLAEQSRSLSEVDEQIQTAFSSVPATGPRSVHEARRVVLIRHLQALCQTYRESVQYVEDLLRKQLILAIGKEVTPTDFAEYVKFHNSRLFAQAYRPRPFCYAVRRSPSHSPEGVLSIEEKLIGDMPLPVDTVVAAGVGDQPMQFPISAAVNVTFRGERFVHASMQHAFSNSVPRSLSLVAKAREFSSMIVMVGRIASATTFEPKFAAIVQNQDELTIPLKLSTIPTPKEFKDAISSLSPEQQSFAKAFRSMQLASTLFGILVVQIKPQLERVLSLPTNSLTKEIRLTQDLMELFIKYQIPSDLLAFDPTVAAATAADEGGQHPLAAVKKHVAAIYAMIQAEKEKEILEEKMKSQYNDPYNPFGEYRQQQQQQQASFSFGGHEVMMASASAGAPAAGSTSFGAGAAPASFGSFGAGAAPASFGSSRHQVTTTSASAGAPAAGSISFGAGAVPPPTPIINAPPPGAAAFAPPPIPPPQGGRHARATSGSRHPEHTQQPTHEHPQQQEEQRSAGGGGSGGGAVDYTLLPNALEAKMEVIDRDSPLRPTIIDVGDTWTKKAKAALLATPKTTTLAGTEQKMEKDATFDLLDALSKSGGLELDHASLHVVIAATHCFDKNIIDTVITDNVNPADKVERSTLIMASTIHGTEPTALVAPAQLPRLAAASPMLFLTSSTAAPNDGSATAREEKVAGEDF